MQTGPSSAFIKGSPGLPGAFLLIFASLLKKIQSMCDFKDPIKTRKSIHKSEENMKIFYNPNKKFLK